jgi:hypothetical protein
MYTDGVKIKSIDFTRDECGNREVHVGMSNGEVVKIARCHESWEQYNAVTPILRLTVDVADRVNGWLHGGEEPYVEDLIG